MQRRFSTVGSSNATLTRRTKILALLLPTAFVLPALAACSSDDAANKSGRLLAASSGASASPGDEAERRRKMMAVRALGEDGQTRELEDAPFFAGLTNKCYRFCSRREDPVRKVLLCNARIAMCTGELYLAMAGFGEPPELKVTIQDGDAGSHEELVKILPQSNATNLGFLRSSIGYFATAISQSGALLNGSGAMELGPVPPMIWNFGTSNAELLDVEEDTHAPYGEQATSVLMNAYARGKQAFEGIAKTALAVSDADRSSNASPTLSSERAAFWRGIAAEMMVRSSRQAGAVGELLPPPGLLTSGFCSSPELTPQAKTALDILRQAALSPDDVLASSEFQPGVSAIRIEDLVDGKGARNGSPVVPHGSVRERLEEYWGMAIPSVADHYGLRYGDFSEARTYLAQEILAFSRSHTATLGKLPLLSGARSQTFEQYSATATLPSKRGSEYYTALASVLPQRRASTGEVFDDWVPQYAKGTAVEYPTPTVVTAGYGSVSNDFTLAAFTAYGYRWAKSVLARTSFNTMDQNSADGASLRAQVVGPLGTLLNRNDWLGNLEYCWNSNAPTTVEFSPKPGRLLVVRGEAGLDCARTGKIEGEACVLGDASRRLVVAAISETSASSTPVPPGFNDPSSGTQPERWYLMKPRANLGSATPKEGDYEAVMGFAVQGRMGTPSGQVCRLLPIVPEAFELVGRLLAPSPVFCSAPDTNCDGTAYDSRIPLEDELTNDGDDAESSWKHYLTLARQAADESDLFGREYVESGLAVDQEEGRLEDQAAATIGQLQSICGSAVDPRLVLEKLSDTSGDGLENADLGPCPATGPAQGNVCVGGRQLRDPLTIAEQIPGFAQCIQRFGETVDYAHLGDASLCMWRNVATGKICDGSGDDLFKGLVGGLKQRCPSILEMEDTNRDGKNDRAKDANGDGRPDACGDVDRCPGCSTSRPLATPISVSEENALKLFSTVASMPARRDSSLCDDLRTMRRGQGNDAVMNRIRNSDLFNLTSLRGLRERLGFEARYNAHAAVWVDGARKYVTGDAETGAQTVNWPCGAQGKASGCTQNDPSLLCAQANCSSFDARGAISERLLRAVWAAQYTTWQDQHRTDGPVLQRPPPPTEPPLPLTLPYYLSLCTPLKGPVSHTILETNGGDASATKISIDVAKNGLWTLFRRDGASLDGTHPGERAHTLGVRGFAGKSRWNLVDPDLGYFALLKVTPDRLRMNNKRVTTALDPDAYWKGMSIDSRRISGVVAQLLIDGTTPEGFSYPDSQYLLGADYRHLPDEWQFRFLFNIAPTSNWVGTQNDTDTNDDPVLALAPDCLKDGDADAEDVWGPNAKSLVDYSLTPQAVLDGAELLCEVAAGDSGNNCLGSPPPKFTTLSDLAAMGDYLRCAGDEVRRRAATAVFAGLPKGAFDPLRRSAGGPYETVGGDLGRAVSELRSALMQVASSGPEIGGIIRNFGEDLRALEHAVALNGMDEKINQAEFEAKQFATSAGCVTGILGGVASGASSGTSQKQSNDKAAAGGFGGMLGCMSGFAELGFLEQLRNLQDEKLGEELALVISQYSQRFANHAQALEKQALALTEALEEVNRKLGDVESLRQSARRALNDSLWALSKRNHGPVTEVMTQRRETARVRYEQAFDHAKQMAFLAKRAIEQRLGMKLADLREDLPLVAAPQTWEGTVCATTGIDYNALRQPGDDRPNNYADAFIGDYVTKLENVVEAYRLRYNFHEGTDTAVISLRDDIDNVRKECPHESRNLFYRSGDFTAFPAEPNEDGEAATDSGQSTPRWLVRGVRVLPKKPPAQDLLAFWPLEGDGLDASGAGNHLVHTIGAPTSTAGQVGSAVKNSCLFGPSAVSIAGAPGITMMAWIRPEGSCASSGSNRFWLAQILGRQSTSYLDSSDFGLLADCFWGDNATRPGVLARARPRDYDWWMELEDPNKPGPIRLPGFNQWAHVAVTWQASGEYKPYLNGQSLGEVGIVPRFQDADHVLSIGCSIVQWPDETQEEARFQGSIDEVALYRRALSPEEIATYYEATADPVVKVSRCTEGVCKSGSVLVNTGLESERLAVHRLFLKGWNPSLPPRGLVERLDLEPGSYRFSWHTPAASVFQSTDAASRSLDGPNGFIGGYGIYQQSLPVVGEDVGEDGRPRQWMRPYVTFTVDRRKTWDLGWMAAEDDDVTFDFAGAMLERIGSEKDALPGPYEETGDRREVERAVCEDTDGAVFRSTRWTTGCVNLCPDGFSSDCSGKVVEHCYHETSFDISQRGIESGQMLARAGFAQGNFNYRIRSIGLNFVGSGVRDCSESDLPNTCNAAGYVPYSLTHEGPYVVRNHKGDDYRARLFTGHIEHARGLGSERYLTNPLGSADSELLRQYTRAELKGRPLDGNFVLRVWDEPGIDFAAIQDVQIVLNYGYWSRFD